MQTRPWLANYPKGVPANIGESEHNSLVDYITDVLKQFKKNEAFQNFGKSITYGELDKLSTKFGAYLQSRGLEPGDKVALMMPNVLQYPVAVFGILKAGLVIVNTNPLYTPREMEHQFKDSDAKAILIADNFAANLEKIIDKTDINVVITTSIGEMLGMLKGGMINFVLKNIKRAVPKHNLKNTVTFKDAISDGAKFTLKEIARNPDDVIVLQYTGGTTGVSKGAMLTNRNILSNMLQTKAWMEGSLRVSGEVVLSPLPMYHIFAFTVNCLVMLGMGAKTVLVTNPRDIKSLVKEFKTNKITTMTGVNTLFNALINNKEFNELDLDLRVTVGGGMAVQQVVAEKWKEVTGCILSEGYGMTEASPVVTVNPIDGSAKVNTIGMPIPSTDVAIFDDKNQMLPAGQVGELRVKGPQVMKGYYKRPEETDKCFVDGWLCTGDMAMMQEDGYFKIVDRKKDMILVSGFNVFPNEIEDVIAMHPKVMEVAAIGIPHDKSGECVKVFVVKKEKSLNEKELLQYARENLTGYKVPKEIEFIKELPKSNVGKILRRKLREL